MGKIAIIFTTDYEIFGDGSGCIDKCMLEPTERMAALLEKYHAPLTIFVDVCAYWAFELEYKKGSLKIDYAGKIKTQLQNLVGRGHDVQLHFHPQWLDYSFDGKVWKLNYELWRISSLQFKDDVHPERGLQNLFARGKKTLEDIIVPVKPDYKCEIFRAGAWSMQPEKDVLRAMAENDFKIDSTVVPGLSFKDDLTFYDFTQYPDVHVWPVHDKITKENHKGFLMEVPIFSTEISLWRRLYFLFLKKRRKIATKPAGCRGTAIASANKGKLLKIKEVIKEKRKMFTFGDATSHEEMIYFVRKALEKYGQKSEKDIPVVAISHPKAFANEIELENFLRWCENQDSLSYHSFLTYETNKQ